jgi:hypothetical protein
MHAELARPADPFMAFRDRVLPYLRCCYSTGWCLSASVSLRFYVLSYPVRCEGRPHRSHDAAS